MDISIERIMWKFQASTKYFEKTKTKFKVLLLKFVEKGMLLRIKKQSCLAVKLFEEIDLGISWKLKKIDFFYKVKIGKVRKNKKSCRIAFLYWHAKFQSTGINRIETFQIFAEQLIYIVFCTCFSLWHDLVSKGSTWRLLLKSEVVISS